MAACALEFESGEIGVYQVLASKRSVGAARLPLTRDHLHNTTIQLPIMNTAFEPSVERVSTKSNRASESSAKTLRLLPT